MPFTVPDVPSSERFGSSPIPPAGYNFEHGRLYRSVVGFGTEFHFRILMRRGLVRQSVSGFRVETEYRQAPGDYLNANKQLQLYIEKLRLQL